MSAGTVPASTPHASRTRRRHSASHASRRPIPAETSGLRLLRPVAPDPCARRPGVQAPTTLLPTREVSVIPRRNHGTNVPCEGRSRHADSLSDPDSMPDNRPSLRRGCTMKPSFTNRLSVAGVLLATLGLPAAAAAQYQLPTLTSSAKADSLHDAAAALVAAHRWGDAARLHRRSADLRDADDPLGFRCLKEAAALDYATGDRTAARGDMAARGRSRARAGRPARRRRSRTWMPRGSRRSRRIRGRCGRTAIEPRCWRIRRSSGQAIARRSWRGSNGRRRRCR